MDNPFFGADETTHEDRLARLSWLIEIAGEMGMERMVIPFVDASSIDGEAAEIEVVSNLLKIAQLAERLKVEIHLETDLPPQPFARVMERLSNPIFKVNYDSGNSAALGYQVADEFTAYGSHVGSVHIKDRELHGTTVKLGTGACDFPELFNQLDLVGYEGAFILQVARGTSGEETDLAISNRQFTETFMKTRN
jgi:L-ribulose-5-phosphate 3-epimerase